MLVQEIEAPPNDSTHLWYWITSMSLDENGSILAVFNMKPPRVSILDTRTLELKATWGVKGKGPGEFDASSAWVGVIRDKIFVSQGHRTSVFSLQGSYLDRDVLTIERTALARLHVERTTGVDQFFNVYYWDARLSSDYFIGKKTIDGSTQYIVRRGDFGFDSGSKKIAELRPLFCVLKDGSIILALSHSPAIACYAPNGVRKWIIDISREFPPVKNNYAAVESGTIKLPMSNLWADEMYTILTFSNLDKTRGAPNIYYLFLDSKTGKLVQVAYAAQNIIREVSKDPDEILSHHLYSPWAIAHHDGTLYAFSYNSSRLQKYKLIWHQ